MQQEEYILEMPKTRSISIVVERKTITSCRLKISPSQRIKLSVPVGTSSDWIIHYLQNKKDWIIKTLENFEKTRGYEATGIIHHGMSIRMLGQDMVFSIYQSEKNQVSTEYRSINIGLSDTSAEQKAKRLFESWWRIQAYSIYGNILDSLYPIMKKHNIKKLLNVI